MAVYYRSIFLWISIDLLRKILMSLFRKKLLMGLMLIILLMNMMLLAFQAKAVLHDLKQMGTPIASVASVVNDQVVDHQDVPELIEHQLLHAADHVQFFLFTSLPTTSIFSHQKTPSRHIAINLVAMMLESPFRPPRLFV
jgi:hypothetical protein